MQQIAAGSFWNVRPYMGCGWVHNQNVAPLLCHAYRLDSQLTSVQSGNSGSNTADADAGSAAPWQQQAADGLASMHLRDGYSHEHEHEDYHEHEYEYDSADDDDWHDGLSRTPGRRPTQRVVTKHARSNSSGSGGGHQRQQQQQHGQQQQRQQLTPQQRGPIPRWRQGQGQGRQRGGWGTGPQGCKAAVAGLMHAGGVKMYPSDMSQLC